MGKRFEVWISGGEIIKTENLRSTLSELWREGVDVWFRELKAPGVWVKIGAYDIGKFLDGEDVEVTITLEPPWYRGLKAFGKGEVNINDFE